MKRKSKKAKKESKEEKQLLMKIVKKTLEIARKEERPT